MRAARCLAPCFVCVIVLSSAGPLFAAQDPPALQAAWKRLDQFVRREMREQSIPGVSLALTDRQRLLHVATYGYANLDARRPLTPDHLLEIGSITKSVTSIALLQLRDEGRLDPLAMAHTARGLTHDLRPRLAVGYEDLFDDRPAHPSHPRVPGTWVEYGAGDGCIAATPADLAAYVRMLLNRGAGPRGRILSEDGFKLLIQPVIKADEDWSYGYGLETRQAFGHTFVAHSGGMIRDYARLR